MGWTAEALEEIGTFRGIDLSGWLGESAEGGARRQRALLQLFAQARAFGVQGAAVVAAPWIAEAEAAAGVWQLESWWCESAGALVAAEGVGELSQEAAHAAAEFFFDQLEGLRPPTLPTATALQHPEHGRLVALDLAVAGRRVAVVMLSMAERAVGWALLEHPLAGAVMVLATGMMRGDAHRERTEQLAGFLASGSPAAPGSERPLTAQEVVERVARVGDVLAERLASVFEVSAVGIFLPDPDDEFVWCLGRHGLERHAYLSGVTAAGPEGVGFGLTASYAMGVAWDPSGSPVVVRSVADRSALASRYLDLGFDPRTVQRDLEPGSPKASRFLAGGDPERAQRGPWVFTAQQIPRGLSPSGRNLVIRLQGRSMPDVWMTEDEQARTTRDRRRSIASAARRVHDELARHFDEGLRGWLDALLEDVRRCLVRRPDWDEVCRSLAVGLSARAVSLYAVRGRRLVVVGWSPSRARPAESFDLDNELDDPREQRLLSSPLTPPAAEVSEEGFLRWPPHEAALGGRSESVCTWPILVGSKPAAVLRVDGAMSAFGAHLRRGAGQDVLFRYRPPRTPLNVRHALEIVVDLLALVVARQSSSADEDWSTWVERVCSGEIGVADARARLAALRSEAGTRGAAADQMGVHRNTFRRHLARLEEAGVVW